MMYRRAMRETYFNAVFNNDKGIDTILEVLA